MSDKTVAAKLLLRPGTTVFPVNAPGDYQELVDYQRVGVKLVTEESELPADLVQVFARTEAELAHLLSTAMAAVKPDGMLWVSYPKVSTGTGEISRQTVHNAIRTHGWRPVAQVAIDDVWSAIRARPGASGEGEG